MKPCSKRGCIYTWILWIAIFLCISFVLYIIFVCDQCKKRRQSREEALQMKESFDDGTQKLILTNCDSLGEFHLDQGTQETGLHRAKLPLLAHRADEPDRSRR